ncbi:hypothetical protein S7711_04785 [Stachybotrys chartarum IBT 7711]|uniref:UEV domain-containing protein n=1 Tax=Stachybotrys chartarum (strain CBS 109288 / IBT 7711) TaxID=1280523 RepID=A0A084ASH5_STACB|nr:hypothetical protein S7711_04785 [Stachybotrys chartarum IBT 7711]
MPVQQHVLNWLYSVLTSPARSIDTLPCRREQTSTVPPQSPSLSPRSPADIYCPAFANGTSALLLHITGTLPVPFRGNTYRFPISVWVPYAYPREPPLVYVIPTQTMTVRPGQHVDPQGQIYHPYLVGWADYWDKSTLQDFLAVLADVFAKEPPVVSRQQSRPIQTPQAHASPPPLPPHPPEMAPSPVSQVRSPGGGSGPPPPPKPPKPHAPSRHESPGLAGARTNTSDGSSGPPPAASPAHVGPNIQRPSRYDSAPPLPPQPVQPGPSTPAFQGPPPQHYPHQAVDASRHHYHHQQQYRPSPDPIPRYQPQPASGWSHANNPTPQQQQQQRAPPPDLLDEPLSLGTSLQAAVNAPPVPPNPEKDALLRQLAQTLASIRQRSRQQNESTMAGLQAQRAAMIAVIPTLQAELGQLTQLSGLLTSNTNILHDALHKADSVIEGSRSHPAPDIDELLVAPTVVSNQLYTLVAEERALGDAIFMLGRAVERGRISPAVFAKMTRSLAREWYLKKALVKKIGDGMGLAS